MIFEDYVKMVEEKKMTVGAACEALGISRQTWYHRLNKKDKIPGEPGRPRKNPVERCEKTEVFVPKIDWVEVAVREKAEQAEWLRVLDKANAKIAEFLNQVFPRLWCNLRFEHVDAAGYWYTFELVNDDRRQTWCVRHSEVWVWNT